MRSYFRLLARVLAVISLGIAIAGGASGPAWAHTDADSFQTEKEHAAEDRSGTAMEVIERETAANAQRIERETGSIPGRGKSDQRVPHTVEAMAAASDAGSGGTWSSVIPTEVVPVFQAVLPNGKVLMWDSVGEGDVIDYPDHTFTRALVWDPTTDTSRRVDVQGYNIFCAGFSQLADGNVFVAGGNKDAQRNGIVQTHIFDWRTETWSRGPDMASERWYPSVTSLYNGEASIIGGGPAVAEVLQTNKTLRRLTGFNKYSARMYPFVTSRPDSRIQLVGPYAGMYTVATGGAGSVTGTATRDGFTRDYGSFATYTVGRTLISGGGNLTEGGKTKVPSKTAVSINTNATATVAATTPMNYNRRQHNLTLLADGSVLATGGESSTAQSGLVDLVNAVRVAERWDPATGKWTVLAPADRVRQYHSAATLLPDGRVLTGGGGVCTTCTNVGYLEKNIEYFTPPYLYKQDGSGQLAPRPLISVAPATVAINTAFNLTSSQAASIRKVGLVRLGATTHSVDQGQRYVPLNFKVSGTTITANGPFNGGVTPPGYYMLFITDAAGVPSVAKIVRVAAGATPAAVAIRGIGNRCIDLPYGDTTNGRDLWMYDCNGTAPQFWTPIAADKSLRVLGKCMDLTGNRKVSGTRIQSYNCNGTPAQKWARRSDGTIRLDADQRYCVGVVNGSTALKAALELRTCNGSAAQKWTWY